MQRLACIFFQVRAGQVHGFQFRLAVFFDNERQAAALNDRNFKLTDLITLGQIRVKVIFTCENGCRRNGRANGQTELNRAFYCATVQYRQHAGQREVNRAGLRVGCCAKGDGRTAENLGGCRELRVGFQPDHHFPLHDVSFWF